MSFRHMATFLVLLTLVISPAFAASRPDSTHLIIQSANPALAKETRRIIDQARPRLAELTGVRDVPVRVVIAQNRAEFSQMARNFGAPDWAAGLAVRGRGLILVRSPGQLYDPRGYTRVLVHELTHVYLDAWRRRNAIPLWLEEGLAMYASGEGGSWGHSLAMTRGVLAGELISFSELASSFPADERRAGLAYAQAHYFIAFLLERDGPKAVSRLLKHLLLGRSLTGAMHRVTGRGMLALEAEFKKAMESRFSWLTLFGAAGTLWALVGLFAAAGLFFRRRAQLKARRCLPDPKESPGHNRPHPPPRPKGDVLAKAGLASRGPRG